ncbi:MAG: DUF1566 domain-containing protein [Promethearchaeota archaeon]
MRKKVKISIIIAVIGTAVIISGVIIFQFFISPPYNPLERYVLCVRGSTDYGINNLTANPDFTVTDHATGLMWMMNDSGTTMNWSEALSYAENLNFAGYNDWRLPNAKELQSIVNYTRAPDAINASLRGPAIDTNFFNITEEESWFWTSTTHIENGYGVYVCFGIASAYNTSAGDFSMNAHGAGAQRSDPKSGDPADYPQGHGPQGDQIRIYNYVRAVRNDTIGSVNYKVVDTGQTGFFGEGNNLISEPIVGQPYYGQDAHYDGFQFSYQDNGDGTINDCNTGLMWQKAPASEKYNWNDVLSYAENLFFAGYSDWRLPTIKELYSLINFNGDINTRTPYINTDYFDFEYPDTSTGARIIDAQYWSSTKYVGKIMYGQEGAFGVNFADGRIKCYPLSLI